MKHNETASNPAANGITGVIPKRPSGQSHKPTFAKVIDGRKHPIRGLWGRNGRFHAQFTIENPLTGFKKFL